METEDSAGAASTRTPLAGVPGPGDRKLYRAFFQHDGRSNKFRFLVVPKVEGGTATTAKVPQLVMFEQPLCRACQDTIANLRAAPLTCYGQDGQKAVTWPICLVDVSPSGSPLPPKLALRIAYTPLYAVWLGGTHFVMLDNVSLFDARPDVAPHELSHALAPDGTPYHPEDRGKDIIKNFYRVVKQYEDTKAQKKEESRARRAARGAHNKGGEAAAATTEKDDEEEEAPPLTVAPPVVAVGGGGSRGKRARSASRSSSKEEAVPHKRVRTEVVASRKRSRSRAAAPAAAGSKSSSSPSMDGARAWRDTIAAYRAEYMASHNDTAPFSGAVPPKDSVHYAAIRAAYEGRLHSLRAT